MLGSTIYVLADPHVTSSVSRLDLIKRSLILIQWIFTLPCCMFSVGHVGVYYRVSEIKSGGINMLIILFLGWSSAGLDEWSRLSSYGSLHHLLSECAGINVIKAVFEMSNGTA